MRSDALNKLKTALKFIESLSNNSVRLNQALLSVGLSLNELLESGFEFTNHRYYLFMKVCF